MLRPKPQELNRGGLLPQTLNPETSKPVVLTQNPKLPSAKTGALLDTLLHVCYNKALVRMKDDHF